MHTAAAFAASLLCLALMAPGGAAGAQGTVTGPLPPDTTITFGPEGWTNLTRPVFGYQSDNPEAWFECRLDSGPFEPCGPATYEVLEGHRGAKLSEGNHTIEVRAVGPDGEADPTPAQAVITVDTHPPTATIISGPTGFTHRQRPTFTLQVAGADSFRCSVIGKNVRVTVPSCDGPASFTPPRPLPEGTYELVVVARDLAANETEDRVEFSVRTKPGPPPPPPDPYRGSILYTGRGKGVKKVEFRLKGHKLIEASVSVNLVCVGGGRRHRYLYVSDSASPRRPIAVDKRGGFRVDVNEISTWEDETVRLTGQITPRRIAGSIAVSWTQPAKVGNETCHTGRFRPGTMEELSFRARRHPPRQ
ncbi:MAG TPA: Ig-like domain-containing protein [Solirubrobacterales bacterium]|nr:Ig-like domain-containing protein [Solirubrobacterales bacterium]